MVTVRPFQCFSIDDPELELIPGEVTRDEMEQARGTKKDGDDHDHYEIYETI